MALLHLLFNSSTYKLSNERFYHQQVNFRFVVSKFIMKLLYLFIAIVSAGKKVDTDYCSFKNCSRCDIALKSDKKGVIYNRFGPQCRLMMNEPTCCRKFMICDLLTECIPRFRRGYWKLQWIENQRFMNLLIRYESNCQSDLKIKHKAKLFIIYYVQKSKPLPFFFS